MVSLRSASIHTFIIAIAFAVSASHSNALQAADIVFGEYVGSVPGGDSNVPLIGITEKSASPIRWHLTLYSQSADQPPIRFALNRSYNLQSANAQQPATLEHSAKQNGTCKTSKGIPGHPNLEVYELEGLCSVARLDKNVLHCLNEDRSLMVGTGGQSFTLYAVDKTEEPGDLAMALARPSATYKIDPVSTGPNVFAVFEGRTPARGVASLLGMGDDRGRLKAKWRLTLYQAPDTTAPTTYKIEGTLFRQQVRQGTWEILNQEKDGAGRTIYLLHAANDQSELLLLKGDDNVLFFLNPQEELLIGHADFSYTLNRRQEPAAK